MIINVFFFAGWTSEHLIEEPNFTQKIIFKDEAQFWSSGSVSRENYCIWANSRKLNKGESTPSA